jgi:hypothetical protein
MIKLTEKLAITADEHQYLLGRPRERADKAGNAVTSIDNPTYYTTLSSALKSALARTMREKVQDGAVTTMRGYLDELQRLQDEFAKLLEPLE